jgi:hypothetical protein
MAGGNNYLFTNATTYSDGSHTYNIKTNTISCGTGHPNACSSGYVYGCATLNNSGATGCVTLALSAPFINAYASNGQVVISWQAPLNNNIDRYIVQHSSNGADWSPFSEVASNALQSAYSIRDAQAGTGDNYYRLQVVDRDGRIAYSAINIVKLEAVTGQISLYPNPVKGHIFYLKTPGTDPLIVKVYTMGGQLLTVTSLKGQTQYSVQLPASLISSSYILVQVIGNGRTQTFTVLAQ